MKACAGGNVEVEIGVVHGVQAPQGRDGMKHDVLEVDCEIERHDRGQDLEPAGQHDVVEQTPAALGGDYREPDGRYREEQAKQDGVEHDDADVARPAPPFRDRQNAAWRSQFPQRHRGENAQEGDQANGGFVTENVLVHESYSGIRAPAEPYG